jgi:hypothetical protein
MRNFNDLCVSGTQTSGLRFPQNVHEVRIKGLLAWGRSDLRKRVLDFADST